MAAARRDEVAPAHRSVGVIREQSAIGCEQTHAQARLGHHGQRAVVEQVLRDKNDPFLIGDIAAPDQTAGRVEHGDVNAKRFVRSNS